MTPGASLPCAAALLQILLWVNKRNLPCRRGTEDDRGGTGNQRCEKENIQIQVNVQAAGKVFWSEPQQGANRLPGNHKAEGHADKGQRHAFREHLPGQPPR